MRIERFIKKLERLLGSHLFSGFACRVIGSRLPIVVSLVLNPTLLGYEPLLFTFQGRALFRNFFALEICFGQPSRLLALRRATFHIAQLAEVSVVGGPLLFPNLIDVRGLVATASIACGDQNSEGEEKRGAQIHDNRFERQTTSRGLYSTPFFEAGGDPGRDWAFADQPFIPATGLLITFKSRSIPNRSHFSATGVLSSEHR